MDDFLIIDKDEGITSFGVIRKLRGILGIKKIGHAGTLDPMATGVLLLALGKATKKLANLILKDKEYEAEIMLGIKSDTYDREGKVEIGDLSKLEKLSESFVESVLNEFKGEFMQMPPLYSAKKIKGKRACDLMREGKKVELKAKQVELFDVKLKGFEFFQSEDLSPGKSLVLLKVWIHCGSGFYIRSLAYDLGEKIGAGGLLWNLRRTRVGDFCIKDAKKISEL